MEDLTREFVAESREGLDRMELCLTELERQPGDRELLPEIFRVVHTIKGTTSFLGFTRLQALAHAGEGLLAALRDGKIAVTPERINGLLALADELQNVLGIIEASGTEGERRTDDDCELLALLAELQSGNNPTSQNRDEGQAVFAQIPGASSAQERTLRVDVDVLNRMMNMVGELVLTRNQILQCAPGAECFPELARRLNGVTTELREAVTLARMQPVGHLFSKFPRMVRDLAATCGRRVRIEFEGRETGLDKSLLEAIRDPLTHAVRNAIDHGIEPPEERVRIGKPVEGLVRLRAVQQNGAVAIEVIDDGAGISSEQVLAKAIERGLVTKEQAAAMGESEALQMIFVAGFSTAKEVTNVSGRGVGMDVVRANVEKVAGSVEVESHVGSGTTVRLSIPLTLAIVPALVVKSGGQNFVLPQSSLVELVDVPRREAEAVVQRVGAAEVYRLRDGLLPLVWLDRVLSLEENESARANGFYIAVVEAEGRRFALAVDDLRAPEEIVVKPLSAALREIGVFSGATMLGNGTLAMILDVAALGALAGVKPEADKVNITNGEVVPAGEPAPCVDSGFDLERSMVIYESWTKGAGDRQRARVAVPLSAVERIASIQLSEIEFASGRAMLQDGDELIPLEDDDELLLELGAATNGLVTVLICLRPGAQPVRRVGKVVRRVVEVSSGTLLGADPELCHGQLAMVNSRVATVHREFSGQPQVLQEVA